MVLESSSMVKHLPYEGHTRWRMANGHEGTELNAVTTKDQASILLPDTLNTKQHQKVATPV